MLKKQFSALFPIVIRRYKAAHIIWLLTTIAGLSSLIWLPALMGWLWLLLLSVVSVIGLCFYQTRLLGLFLLGLCWAVWHGMDISQAVPISAVDQPFEVSGVIVGLPLVNGEAQQFVVRVKTPSWLHGYKLRASWYRAGQVVRATEQWRFTGKLQPVYATTNPQGFDYDQWLLAQRISGTLSITDATMQKAAVVTSIDYLRDDISAWIRTHLSGAAAHLAMALIVGDRTQLSTEHTALLQRTGTGHLLAISGLHVGMVAMLGWLLGKGLMFCLVWRRYPFSQHAILLCLPVVTSVLLALAYSCLAGLAVSTERALIMLLLTSLAWLIRRRIDMLRLWLITITLVLFLNPLSILGAGFWLSFVAVFWLWWSLSYRPLRQPWWKKIPRVQCLLILGLLPIQLLWFHQLSVTSLPANLVAIPVVSLMVLPLLLLAILLYLCTLPGASILLIFSAKLLDALLLFLQWIDAKAGYGDYALSAWQQVPAPSWSLLILACAGCVWLLAPRGIPLRYLGIALLLPFVFPKDTRPVYGIWDLRLFDIGQGLAIAIRTRHHVLVYDTGPGDGRGRDRVASAMLPTLRDWGAKVDQLVISHGDLDHAGGLLTIHEELNIISTFSSKAGMGEACTNEQSWRWDGVDFQFLHPSAHLPYLGNDSSCVLLIRSDYGDILLPGDISQVVEQRLLNTYAGPEVDLLIVGHHGSHSSSSKKWLEAVNPKLALVSAGRWNRFDMPHQQPVNHFSEQSIALVNTADCGALSVKPMPNKTLTVNAEILSSPRWWKRRDLCDIRTSY